MTEGNDVKHSWIGLNSCFSASPKHALTFLIVGDSISASRRVCFIANLGDRRGVDAIFNEGIYTWVLKIVTDSQTDSLTNLIKCVVICRSYSYAFWSTSLWAPVIIIIIVFDTFWSMGQIGSTMVSAPINKELMLLVIIIIIIINCAIWPKERTMSTVPNKKLFGPIVHHISLLKTLIIISMYYTLSNLSSNFSTFSLKTSTFSLWKD